jgi:hypothetical protein
MIFPFKPAACRSIQVFHNRSWLPTRKGRVNLHKNTRDVDEDRVTETVNVFHHEHLEGQQYFVYDCRAAVGFLKVIVSPARRKQ